LAGPPGSGKSTLAKKLTDALNAQGQRTVLVPMDGFHLDNRVLTEMNRLQEKGAPDTFDSAGFLNAIRRLKTGEEVVLPVFDRDRELAIAGSIVVPETHQTLVVEGNYLCCNQPPWDQLNSIWDFSVYLDVAREELERRLVQRWLDQGFTFEKARHRADVYDLANADFVAGSRLETDLVIRTGYE
jgi:pantothenate kinase